MFKTPTVVIVIIAIAAATGRGYWPTFLFSLYGVKLRLVVCLEDWVVEYVFILLYVDFAETVFVQL